MSTSDQLNDLLKTLPNLLGAVPELQAEAAVFANTSSSDPVGTVMALASASSSDPVSAAFESIGNFYNLMFQVLLSNNDVITPSQFDALFTTLTPSSDLVFSGFSDFQLVFGRTGNDILYPFDHDLNQADETPVHIDMYFGDSEVIKTFLFQDFLNILGGNPPTGGADTFVLGDWRKSYFADSGYNDFAFIFDFNSNQDKIQLRGSADDYETVTIPFLGTAIFEKTPESTSVFDADLVGIVFANYNLSLSSSNFDYVGTAPSTALTQPKIKQFGTPGLEFGHAVTTDLQGNVFAVGSTNGALEGSNIGSYDSWINKYNSDGQLLWGRQVGSSKYDLALGATTDKFGNLYVVGGTQGDLVDPRQSLTQDSWIAKYDSNGNQLWIQQLGSEYLTAATNVVVDDTGAAYISGLTVQTDPRPDSNLFKVIPLQDDFWVTKYDTDGNKQWFTQVASPENSVALFDEAYGVTLGLDGKVYATGWTYGDFSGQGGSLDTFRYYDAWLAKFDNSTGQLEKFSPNPGQDVVQFGSANFDFSWGVDADSQGNLYNAGWTRGDLGGTSAGQEDIWIAKTRPDGTQEWVKQFGTSGADGMYLGNVVVNSDDQIFLSGYTDGSLGGQNAGSFDIWVASYNSNGDQLWLKQFGTSEADVATKVAADTVGNLYVTGYTEGSLGAVNAGALDTWIAKLDAKTGDLKDFNKAVTPTPTPTPTSTPTPTLTPTSTSTGGTPSDTAVGTGGGLLPENLSEPPSNKSLNKIVGTPKNNRLAGTSDNDEIKASGGHDYLKGKQGNDILIGGKGKDILWGGKGDDRMSGGKDGDTFIFKPGDGNDTITDFMVAAKANSSKSLTSNADSLRFVGGGLTAHNMLLRETSVGLEITFEGVAGNKIVLKNVELEDFNDLLRPATAKRKASDLVHFSNEKTPSDSFDVFTAGLSRSTVFRRDTVTFLNDLNNIVSGFDGSADVINGHGGNDSLQGLGGDDLLRGGAGDDTLLGNDGNDGLDGGSGNDTLTGGAGSDRFIFTSTQSFALADVGVDTVTDFLSGTDKIVLDKTTFSTLNSVLGLGFSTPSEFTTVITDADAATSVALIVYNSANGKLFYNANKDGLGLGTGSQFATLSGLPALAATDFVLQA